MFYNFKNKELISLNNIRYVCIYSDRPCKTEYWYIRIRYLDEKAVDLLVNNYEDAQNELQKIESMLNK